MQAAAKLERARRSELPLSVVVLELDNFNVINSSFGMEMGKEVLQILSHIIREKSRPYDCIGRWAGDEFVLVLAGVIGADAERVARESDFSFLSLNSLITGFVKSAGQPCRSKWLIRCF